MRADKLIGELMEAQRMKFGDNVVDVSIGSDTTAESARRLPSPCGMTMPRDGIGTG
jgi:hypothetical protein